VRVNIYVDGFNLYYGAVKSTPYKWLNIAQMCQLMLPKHTIQDIKYFTARITARPNDQSQPQRQATFLRALSTLPNLTIIYGHFLTNEVWMPVVNPAPGAASYAHVYKTEEKGSDVNIATHLLNDGYKGRYEAAALITNDSDLCEPIRIVRQELGLDVGLLSPYARPSKALLRHVSFVKPIREGVLRASQFPPIMSDAVGQFHKPTSW